MEPHKFLFILLAIFIISGCQKEDTKYFHTAREKPQLEKTSAYSGEIITIHFDGGLNNTIYNVNINNEPHKMVAIGNSLSFKVPSLDQGLHELSIKIGGISHSFNLYVKEHRTVETPDSLLSDFLFDFKSEISELKNVQDAMLRVDLMDTSILSQDLTIWNQVEHDNLQNGTEDFTTTQKREFASFLAINKGWLHQIDQKLLGQNILQTAADEAGKCIQLMREGGQDFQNNNEEASWGQIIESFWCSVDSIEDTNPETLLSKVATLWVMESSFPNKILLHTIGRKVDLISKMIASLARSPSVAKNVVLADDVPNQGEAIEFCHEKTKQINITAQYRSIQKSSINSNAADAAFAEYFYDFINYYTDYKKTLQKRIKWRPSFKERTKTVSINRYLNIPDSSITNDKVKLINAENNNNAWGVVFHNTTKQTQHFNFRIIYDDGHAECQSSAMGKLHLCQP